MHWVKAHFLFISIYLYVIFLGIVLNYHFTQFQKEPKYFLSGAICVDPLQFNFINYYILFLQIIAIYCI